MIERSEFRSGPSEKSPGRCSYHRVPTHVLKEATLLPPDEGGHHFLNELRWARSAVLDDVQNADAPLTAFERLGYHLERPSMPVGLGSYRAKLIGLARRSELGESLNMSAEVLFDLIVAGRNEHMHVGVSARHLADHCVQFSLMLEAGLMSGMHLVKHFMVAAPTCGEHWQTVAQARQAMLLNQFSYLPYLSASGEGLGGEESKHKRTWPLLADHEVARYLLNRPNDRHRQLARLLEEAIPGDLRLIDAPVIKPTDELPSPSDLRATPFVVAAGRQLMGILTSFDLL